jgi:hypothetical protein
VCIQVYVYIDKSSRIILSMAARARAKEHAQEILFYKKRLAEAESEIETQNSDHEHLILLERKEMRAQCSALVAEREQEKGQA